MIAGPAGFPRLGPVKAETQKIKIINKDIDHPNRIVFANPVFQPLRKQGAPSAVHALNKTLHEIPAKDGRIMTDRAFLQSLNPWRTLAETVAIKENAWRSKGVRNESLYSSVSNALV